MDTKVVISVERDSGLGRFLLSAFKEGAEYDSVRALLKTYPCNGRLSFSSNKVSINLEAPYNDVSQWVDTLENLSGTHLSKIDPGKRSLNVLVTL